MAIPTFERNYVEAGPRTQAHARSRWIAKSPTLGLVLIALAAAGCAVETASDTVSLPSESTVEPQIFGGSQAEQRTGVAGTVALRVGVGTTFELCSGALVAPNVVLTARHCVSKTITATVSCDENGRSANGAHIAASEVPESIGVYVGGTPSFARKPATKARAIITPATPYLCDADIAFVILESPILDVQPLAVRTRSAARQGEKIRSIGYGQNDSATPIGTRFSKDGVEVLAQGKGVSKSKTPLGIHEFEVGRSICQGDSGGPAISEQTGAVIGVVSRGGDCEEDFGHIYTTTSGFDSLFAEAFAVAGAVPALEAEPSSGNAAGKSALEPGGVPAALGASTEACSTRPGPRSTNYGILAVTVACALSAVRRRRRRRSGF